MFYRLGKDVRKTWQPPPPSPLYARGFNAKGDDGVLLGKLWENCTWECGILDAS